MTNKIFLGLAVMLILIVPTTSLSAQAVLAPLEPQDSDKYVINGGGATFPFPLIDKWRVDYNSQYPGITLNYQAVGSGAGISLFTKNTVDFAASDAPLQPPERKSAPANTLHIPETMGAIVVVYNLPGVTNNGLKLTGQIIADIYLGKISKWNDPAIKALNPDIPNLLGNNIVLVHRSDGSGTTFAFTDYLSKVSSDWKGLVGQGKSVPWVSGIGASGNAGVAAIVKKVPYSLGYVELAYAKQNYMVSTGVPVPMTYAYIQNHDKTAFLDATLDTTLAAAQGSVNNLPESNGDWSQVSINDAPGANSYPIATFTYLLVNGDLDKIKGMDKQKAQDLVHMLYWFVTNGQKDSAKLLYVPLPAAVQEIDKRGIAMIKFQGQQIFAYDNEVTTSTAKIPSTTATITPTPTKIPSTTTNITSTTNINSGGTNPIIIPSWVKNNAKWWHDGSIGDVDFEKGIQFMIQNGLIKIGKITQTSPTSQSPQIPSWIKNNAGWWASGQMDDGTFEQGIQYMVSNGIITVKS